MLVDKLSDLIKEATLNKDQARLRTLRLIKAEFTEFQKSAVKRDLTEEAEFTILRKMISERKETSKLYLEAGRTDLAKNEAEELEIISEFLGTVPSDSEIKEYAVSIIAGDREIRNMKAYISNIRAKFPNADGKLVSDICKSIILGK